MVGRLGEYFAKEKSDCLMGYGDRPCQDSPQSRSWKGMQNCSLVTWLYRELLLEFRRLRAFGVMMNWGLLIECANELQQKMYIIE
jgi:hypothetical protein